MALALGRVLGRVARRSSGHRYPAGVEVLPDLLQAQPHTPLDGPERQVQKLRYLRVGVPGEVRELQHLELLRRQPPQGLPDLLALGVAPGLAERFAGLRSGSLRLDFVPGPAAARSRAQLVYAAVANDREYPGAHACPLDPVASRRA